MADIHIEREHALSHEDLRDTVEQLAQDLQEKEEVEYGWSEGEEDQREVLWFKRSGVEGRIALEPGRLTITADLSMLFRPFRGRITREVEAKLDELLG